MDLAKMLDVPLTIKKIKKLEMAQQEMAWKPCDPRSIPNNPQKRAWNPQQPQGEPQGSTGKGKERAKGGNKVSLYFSGDEMEGYHDDADMEEVNPLFDNGDNNCQGHSTLLLSMWFSFFYCQTSPTSHFQ